MFSHPIDKVIAEIFLGISEFVDDIKAQLLLDMYKCKMFYKCYIVNNIYYDAFEK